MSKVILQACIDTDEIIRSLMDLSQEEIVEFLKELDDTIGDWDFTQLAYEYFHQEIRHLRGDHRDG